MTLDERLKEIKDRVDATKRVFIKIPNANPNKDLEMLHEMVTILLQDMQSVQNISQGKLSNFAMTSLADMTKILKRYET